jgi:stress response protein YsnF
MPEFLVQRNEDVRDAQFDPEVATDRMSDRILPLEAELEIGGDRNTRTWIVRIPVRAERVMVRRPVVLRERIAVHVEPVDESVVVESDLRQERLHVEVDRS